MREQARYWANFHQYEGFSDPSPSSIGNVAGRAILPVVLGALDNIKNSSNPLLLRGVGISYKPFISLFNMTQVGQTYPDLAGVVDYAAAIALEVRHETVTNTYTVTMNFKNGSDATDFTAYNMFGSSNAAYPLNDFVTKLEPYAITSLGQWCNECENTESRGCALVADYNSTTSYNGIDSTIGRQHTSPLAAGFIGSAVTMAIGVAILAAMWFLGMLSIGKKGSRQQAKQHRPESYALPTYDRSYSDQKDNTPVV